MIKKLVKQVFDLFVADGACAAGMDYVVPLIEAGKDVALALRHYGVIGADWLRWAILRNYDCKSAWKDNVYVWGKDGFITATAGDYGTATAGYEGTATAGYEGTATAGDRGTATAGDRGTATAGDYGTATAGDEGTATAGNGGILQIRYWDGSRMRIAVGYVGEKGIEPNKPYRVDNTGTFILA